MVKVGIAETSPIKADELLGSGGEREGIRALDETAKAPWPQNILMSILGWTAFQAESFLDVCPEVLGDVAYAMNHISWAQPERREVVKEFYKEHHTIAEIAAKRKVGIPYIQDLLVETISCMRNSHLPSILLSGLRNWKKNQSRFREERYSLQTQEPICVLEDIGVCEIVRLQGMGISTVGDFIAAFRSPEGVVYDGKQITKDVLRAAYDELDRVGALDNVGRMGDPVEFRVTLQTAPKVRLDRQPVGEDATWPMNLWRAVLPEADIVPPEDLEASIDAALLQLPTSQSAILLYTYREGLDAEAIGEKTGSKPPAVYAAKKRALSSFQEPAIRRLCQYGLFECMRQDEEFKSATVAKMRSFPATVLPLHMLSKRCNAIFYEGTVGDVIDYLLVNEQEGQLKSKQKELCTIYGMLQKSGVLQRHWLENMDIPNPELKPVRDKNKQIEEFLEDLWRPEEKPERKAYCLMVPTDITERLHFGMGQVLTDDERQALIRAYPVLTVRNPKEGTTLQPELERDDVEVTAIMAKLREAASLTPSIKYERYQRAMTNRQKWPTNFLMQVFECQDTRGLEAYMPQYPLDLEKTIDFILHTKLTEGTAKIVRMYFEHNMTCRSVGAALDVSGAYVGMAIKSAMETTLRSYDVKRYLQIGYTAARAEEEQVRTTGVGMDTLEDGFERLGLPQRISNRLHRADVKTVGDTVKILRGEWGHVRGLGTGGLTIIYEALKAAGVVEFSRSIGRTIPKPLDSANVKQTPDSSEVRTSK